MPRFTDMLVIAAAGLAAAGASAVLVQDRSTAADHLDPPSRTDIRFDPTIDLPADIADIYGWTDATHLNLVYTFAGPVPGARGGFYDPAVIYRFHLSTGGRPDDDEFLMEARFGPGTGGNGIRFIGAPGQTAPIIGPVERILEQDGLRVFAGVVDDPFFFDVLGFRATNSTGNLAILNTRDFFTNQNDTMIGIQIPIERVTRDTNGDGRRDSRIDVWVDAYRKGGQL
jgi:Domain of unknown function (DUF4331)